MAFKFQDLKAFSIAYFSRIDTLYLRKDGVYNMNMDKVVCHCMNITNGMIKDAVEAGAKTLEDIQEETGATTVCGACLEDVQRLVDFFVSDQGE